MEGGGQPFTSTGWSSAPPVRPRRGGSRSGGRRKHRPNGKSDGIERQAGGGDGGNSDFAGGIAGLNLNGLSRAKTPEATASSGPLRFKFPVKPYTPFKEDFLGVGASSGRFVDMDVGMRATDSDLNSTGVDTSTGLPCDNGTNGGFSWSVPSPYTKIGNVTTQQNSSAIPSSSTPFTMGAPTTSRKHRDAPHLSSGLEFFERLNLNDGPFQAPPNSQKNEVVVSPTAPAPGTERKRSSCIPDEGDLNSSGSRLSKKVAMEKLANREQKFVFNTPTGKPPSQGQNVQQKTEAGNCEKGAPRSRMATDESPFADADTVAGLVSDLNLGDTHSGKKKRMTAAQGPSRIYSDSDGNSKEQKVTQTSGESTGSRPRVKLFRGKGRPRYKKGVENPNNSNGGSTHTRFEQKCVWPVDDGSDGGMTPMDIDPPMASPPVGTADGVQKSKSSCIYSSGSDNASSPMFDASNSDGSDMRYRFAQGVRDGGGLWNKHRRRHTSRLSQETIPFTPAQPEPLADTPMPQDQPPVPEIPQHAPQSEQPSAIGQEDTSHFQTQAASAALAKAEGFKEKGNSLFQVSRYYEAEVAYSLGINAINKEMGGGSLLAMLYSNRGAARLMLKRPQEALVDCQMAIDCNRKYMKAYQRGAKCLQAMGEFDQAKSLLNKAADMLSASDSQYRTMAEKISDVEGFVKKLEECKESLALSSWSEEFAKSTLEKARQLAEEVYCSDTVAGVQALVLLRGGKYKDLCKHIQDSVQARNAKFPEDAGALIWWKWVHVQALWQMEGKSEEATKETKVLIDWMSREGSAVHACPFGSPWKIQLNEIQGFLAAMDEVAVHKRKGNEEVRKGLFRIAVESYTKGLAICGKSGAPPHIVAYLHSNRGSAYYGLKKYVEAIGDCCRAKALLPAFYRPLSRLAQILCDTRQPDAAVMVLQQALANADISVKASIETRIAECQNSGDSEAMPNHYHILGVDQKCGENEIRKAYKMLALRFHPDKAMTNCRFATKLGPSGTEFYGHNKICQRVKEEGSWLFKAINEANAALMDSDKREILDSELAGYGGAYRRTSRSARSNRWRASSSSYHKSYSGSQQSQSFYSRWGFGAKY